jgi:Na+/proline symporter
VLAATLAASLSSIASAINSCTTVAMVDFYERLLKKRPKIPSQVVHDTHGEGHQDVRLSRIVTVGFGILGVVLAANVQHVGNLIEIANKVIQTFTGPLLGIYFLGMFSRRGTALGALLGGICGTLVGIWVAFFSNIAFFWPTVFGFATTYISGYLFSILSGGKVSERAQQLTWRSVMRRANPDDSVAPVETIAAVQPQPS